MWRAFALVSIVSGHYSEVVERHFSWWGQKLCLLHMCPSRQEELVGLPEDQGHVLGFAEVLCKALARPQSLPSKLLAWHFPSMPYIHIPNSRWGSGQSLGASDLQKNILKISLFFPHTPCQHAWFLLHCMHSGSLPVVWQILPGCPPSSISKGYDWPQTKSCLSQPRCLLNTAQSTCTLGEESPSHVFWQPVAWVRR
jgi:hypothetical protein